MQRSSAAQPALEVAGVGRSFRGVVVVDSFDLTVPSGRRVALVGPNGSGKSTVLRLVAGTLTPDRGTITVLGRPAGSLAARARSGVSLSQERAFYGRLTGRANLHFFARVRGVPKAVARRAVAELEAELELGPILARNVAECSTGMVQQLSFARALLGDPELILLDEPTRSLDDDAVERVWAALRRRSQATVVVASHRSGDIVACDDVVQLGQA